MPIVSFKDSENSPTPYIYIGGDPLVGTAPDTTKLFKKRSRSAIRVNNIKQN
jgi:hypothetical protein